MTLPVPIITSRVLLPVEMVSEDIIKKHYVKHLFTESVCSKCWIKKEGYQRPYHSQKKSCFNCPWEGFTGEFTSYNRLSLKGRDWWSLPSGNLPAIEENLDIDLSEADDRRCDRRVERLITFTGKLYTGKEIRNKKPSPNQVKLVKQFWKSPGRTGIIKAAPRAGKTMAAVYLATKFGRKTLILVHEILLLQQFYKTFVKNTNIREIEAKTGRKLIVIAKTLKDLESDADYLLVNYQKFISELGVKRVARYLIRKYSLAIVDEVHRTPSLAYRSLLNRLDCLFRIGLTATPDRKDGLWPLAEEILGSVVASIDSVSMTPRIYVKKTNFKPPRQWRGKQAYNKSVAFLSSHKQRNIDIVKQVFADLRKNPKASIVIPVKRVNHAKKLVRWINRQAAFNNQNKGEKWLATLADCLWANADKERVLNRARSYKTRVVVTIEKFVRDGIDVPPWNIMYTLFPGNNVVGSTQMTARILTPYEGKPQAILRVWMDDIDIMKNCIKATYTTVYQPLGYRYGKKSKIILEELAEAQKVGKKWIKGKHNMGFDARPMIKTPSNMTISVRGNTGKSMGF